MANVTLKRWNGSAWVEMLTTPASHAHGNISSTGTITTNTAPSSGQHLVITSSGDVVQQSSILIGTGTTTYLRNDGSWATPPDTNNFTNSLSFSKSTGILTLGRSGLASLTANIYDGTGTNAIAIGNATSASTTNAIAIGNGSSSGSLTNLDTIAIGGVAVATGPQSIAIGKNTLSNTISSVALGENTQATGTGSIAIGGGNQTTTGARATASDAIAIGFTARGTATAAVAVGRTAEATNTDAIAIGDAAIASAADAAQIGSGTNSTTGTLQFRSYQLVDNTGTIPAARLPQIPGNWVLVGGSETSATTMAHSSSTSVPTMDLSSNIDDGGILAIEVSSNNGTTTASERTIVLTRLGTNQTTLGMGMISFSSLASTTTGNVNVWTALVRKTGAAQIGTRYGGFENMSATGNKTFGTLYIFRVWQVVD